MKAIDILVKEHDSILKMIDVTRKLLADKSAVNIDHVEQIIDFVRNFADKYHHLKEEDVLFMELEKHGMPREGGPVGVMLSEHDEGRNYIKQAAKAVTEYKEGNTDALTDIESNLLNFCTLLTNHIAKENNILYPMAERMLPGSILETMSLDFEEANLATANNEYHDKYLKMVDELNNIYLK